MSQWFFLYQQKGGEEDWQLELADNRGHVVNKQKPAFVTVLDLSHIPDDGDWSKTRYRGPFYADFDADGDLDLACESFKAFLGRLDGDLGFDISQARLYASGGKGFHVEIPPEAFMAKVPAGGTVWLPYVYEHMARALVVETMDMRVYSGKRGRMWRTPGVKRDNGNFKVPIALDDALTITPELYLQLVSEPAAEIVVTPPHCNSKFALLFESAREKVTKHMRGRKKRLEVANKVLDPWRKAKKTPPTIEALMDGDNIAPGAQFQQLSMQLSIYATSVGMGLDDFVNRCQGLCEKHVSDSRRYNTVPKRREELARMWRYMSDNALYDFDTGPIAALVKPGVGVPDLGVMEKDDTEDRPASTVVSTDVADGDAAKESDAEDPADRIRRGFFMNADGMWRTEGDNTQCVSRAVLRNVEAFYDLEKNEFRGYEFDIWVRGERKTRTMLSADAFASAQSLKKFFVAHQLSFQGGEYEAMSLLDIMAEKAGRGGRTYTYPREGFFVVNNPACPTPEPVKVYLTQDSYRVSVAEDDEAHFRLRYRPTSVTSAYNIDVHKAPELDETMAEALHDLFRFTRPDVCADLVGWFVACHYRSAYLHCFNQFPMLQIYGEAGAGKSQSAWLLAHLHWFMTPISIKSADGFTAFALDAHASSSTSAPLIIDEFKPRELRKRPGGMYEKVKSVLKASYIGADIGERGTVNKGAENHLALVKSKATAPICFLGEAVEMETAIIERSVNVNIHKGLHTPDRTAAFLRLQSEPTVLSSLGRELVNMGFMINLASMKKQVEEIRDAIAASMPPVDDDTRRRAAPRMIFNRAVIVHALRTLQAVLARRYATEFDEDIETLLGTKADGTSEEESKLHQLHAMSEMSKVLNRISILSRSKDKPWEVKHGEDYLIGEGWIEVKVERAYDQYRAYCASIADTPLFDNLDVFIHALNAYSPCIDRTCATSALRKEEDAVRIVRMDSRRLMKEGVQPFKL